MTGPRSPGDVRMRGFSTRTTVAEAIRWVDESVGLLPAERVPLEQACGRVLAGELTAAIDVPGFDRSAMDGYAVRSDETLGAGDYNPLPFELIGESLPGRPYVGSVGRGTTVRIMTGAPLPDGADAVVPAEYASETGRTVEITTAVAALKHVGRVGEDLRAGVVVLPAGRVLRPQDIAVMASLGLAAADVVSRPRVRILITGDELVSPGAVKNPYQIFEANSWMLRGLVSRDGGEVESVQHLRDQREGIGMALNTQEADVTLVSGGSSVGAEDHAPRLLAELGELAIHGVAMRPASPSGMGRIGRTLVFLLPGNPVSCLSSYDFFAGRAIRCSGGRSRDWPYRSIRGVLGAKVSSMVGRVDYCRVRIEGGLVRPLSLSGASILSSTTRADGFLVVPAECEGYAPGAEVDVHLYD